MKDSKTVLITGASSGIGYELAKIFADHKYNVILVARSIDKLKELANKLVDKYKIKADVISADLSKQHSAKKVFEKVLDMKLKVDILINNAGTGKVGLFHEMETEKDIEMIELNVNTLTEMTKIFSVEMVKRREGKILNVASTGSFSPGPFTAVYYATKAYVLSFSEAIAMELKPYNVTVCTICPGATRTNFSKSAGKKDMPGAMSARFVAKKAYDGLENNKRVIIPGIQNKIFLKLPRMLLAKIIFKSQRKLSMYKKE